MKKIKMLCEVWDPDLRDAFKRGFSDLAKEHKIEIDLQTCRRQDTLKILTKESGYDFIVLHLGAMGKDSDTFELAENCRKLSNAISIIYTKNYPYEGDVINKYCDEILPERRFINEFEWVLRKYRFIK